MIMQMQIKISKYVLFTIILQKQFFEFVVLTAGKGVERELTQMAGELTNC